jgi:hypothetical protein
VPALGNVFAIGPWERFLMPEKKRQKKAGEDKNKKNQARRRGGRSKKARGSLRQSEMPT